MLRRGCSAEKRIARAQTSGCTIGGTGIGCFGILVRFQLNWVVFTPGSVTVPMLTLLPVARSSVSTESLIARTAAFAPQYADCSGIDRYAIADDTFTILPRSRGRITRSAARTPNTCPK